MKQSESVLGFNNKGQNMKVISDKNGVEVKVDEQGRVKIIDLKWESLEDRVKKLEEMVDELFKLETRGGD